MPPPRKDYPTRATAQATEVWPGVYRLKAPFNRDLNTWIKEGDDGRFRYHFDFDKAYGSKAWYLPKERLDSLKEQVNAFGWQVDVVPMPCLEVTPAEPKSKIHLTPWQSRGLERLLKDRNLLAQWITGAGKSRLAIEAHNAIEAAHTICKTIVIAPKAVTKTWTDEQLPKWLQPKGEEADFDRVWTLAPGRKLMLKEGRGKDSTEKLRPQPDVLVVSWDSLHKIPNQWSFDLIVFDEMHLGLHAGAARSKAAKTLRTQNPHAVALGLTATPTSTSLTDLHSQIDILCPHRWGSKGKWWRRYFEEVPAYEQYTKPGSLRPHRVDELLAQLSTVCDYVGHEDVGDALPPVSWHEVTLNSPEGQSRVGPPESLSSWRSEQQSLYKVRVSAFLDSMAADFRQSDNSGNIAIVCYHRIVASYLAEKLAPLHRNGINICHIDG